MMFWYNATKNKWIREERENARIMVSKTGYWHAKGIGIGRCRYGYNILGETE